MSEYLITNKKIRESVLMRLNDVVVGKVLISKQF